MKIRIISMGGGSQSRVKTIALAVAAIAVGGIFLAFGIALIASLAVAGVVLGAGVALIRAVRGRPALSSRDRHLDPSMEVFPPQASDARRIENERDAN